MAQPVQRLVVARYKADVNWLDSIQDWQKIVVQKETEDLPGDMPNEGREPAAFLHAIIQNYAAVKRSDIWAFVQDNPFDHCIDFVQLLDKPFNDFAWLGGGLKHTDGEGREDHPNLPVAKYYKKWTELDWDDSKLVPFAPGGQFKVTGRMILMNPKSFYVKMYADVCIDYNAWVAERLWERVFTSPMGTWNVL